MHFRAACLLPVFATCLVGCAPAPTCTWNSDCEGGKVCIDRRCGERVVPYLDAGHPGRAALMFLLDRSASLALPADPNSLSCTPACGWDGGHSTCPAGCRTRLAELSDALTTALTAERAKWRVGLAVFPPESSENSCGGGAARILFDLPTALLDRDVDFPGDFQRLARTGFQFPVGGEAQLAEALSSFANYPQLNDPDHDAIVVLITDGPPGCSRPANSCGDAGACECSTADAGCPACCAEREGAVAAARELAARGIKTLVIAYGPDALAGDAREALRAVAVAGEVARACRSDADCDQATPCVVQQGRCKSGLYAVETGVQLAQLLASFLTPLPGPDRP